MRRARIKVAATQDPRPAEDRVEWRPQFMRQRAEKFIFETIGLLRLTIELDSIEGQADSPFHFFEDERIRRSQPPFALGYERQDRLDLAVKDQRADDGRRRVEALRDRR